MNTTSIGKKVKTCAACGKETNEIVETGRVILCRQCVPDIRVVVDQLRADKKPVNMVHVARRIYRKKHSAGNYLLRDIPKDLWGKAKHRAIDDGDSLRDLILKSLKAYMTP